MREGDIDELEFGPASRSLRHKTFFAEMVTKAVMTLGEGMPLKMIGIKKVQRKR